MGEVEKFQREEESVGEKEEEEARADLDIWKYVFGFVEMAVIKCAIELGVADALETHEHPMTLSDLSTALGCAPPLLYRVMRFLVHRRIFVEKPTSLGSPGYAQTPISRRLMNQGETSMAALVLLESSPPMLAPWHCLSSYVKANGSVSLPFEAAHGQDIWSYAAAHPTHSKLINDAMACDARVIMRVVVQGCAEVFEGLSTVVDVGGGNGTALRTLVKAFPWIRGINFDLAHVVSTVPECEGVECVGGDMFDSVPKADAALLKFVLHDWGDDECILALKKCREAVPQDKGKVIIIEAVIEEEKEDLIKDLGLMLDMVMMAHTHKGKERTLKEWGYVLREAGFSRYTVKGLHGVQSLIEAYP